MSAKSGHARRKRKLLSRDRLPQTWTVEKWDATKAKVLEVLWDRIAKSAPISYKLLVELVPVFGGYRSPVLSGMLTEIALEEHERLGLWVTAIVVYSDGTYSGSGLFSLVPASEWRRLGKTKFCEQEQQRAREWLQQHQ
jgi:hypothetical protein